MMLRLAGLMQAEGIKVDLVVLRLEGEYLKNVPDGVNLVNLGKSKPSRAIFALSGYLKNNTVDVLLSTLVNTNFCATLATSLSGKGVRCVIRDACSPVDELKHDTTLARCLKSIFVRVLYPRASARVALSYGVAEGMHKAHGLPQSSIDVIYNPVDINEIQSESLKPVCHPWLCKKNQIPVLVSVGRLNYQKGFDLLILSISQLSKSIDVRLIILGEGEAREDLTRLIAELNLTDKVDLMGFQANPHAFIAKSSGFIFPSRWEGLGNALVEAMCCNVPILATDCPHGPAEVLEGGLHGLLVPPENVEALTLGIKKILSHQVLPPKPEALSRFEPHKVLLEYLNLFFPEDFENR